MYTPEEGLQVILGVHLQAASPKPGAHTYKWGNPRVSHLQMFIPGQDAAMWHVSPKNPMQGNPREGFQAATPRIKAWHQRSMSQRIRPLKPWEQQGPNPVWQQQLLFLLISCISWAGTHPGTADATTKITSVFNLSVFLQSYSTLYTSLKNHYDKR